MGGENHFIPAPAAAAVLLALLLLAVACPASSAPVIATLTDIQRCTSNTDRICCLPKSKNVTDWKPESPQNPLRIRRSVQSAFSDPAYMASYNLAYQRLRALPVTDPRRWDYQVATHCAYCMPGAFKFTVHGNYLFLPWHRWFLYFHEKILGSLIGDPKFALPYWDWDNAPGKMLFPQYSNAGAYPAIFNNLRNQDPGNLQSGIAGGSDPVLLAQSVLNAADQLSFFGGPMSSAQPGQLEMTCHGYIHMAVGTQDGNYRDMGNLDWAANDAVFYAHHNNLDRLWWLWKRMPAGGNALRREPSSSDFLNTQFLFYDQYKRLVRVKVRDAVLNAKSLRYSFEDITNDWTGAITLAPNPDYRIVSQRRRLLSVDDEQGGNPVWVDDVEYEEIGEQEAQEMRRRHLQAEATARRDKAWRRRRYERGNVYGRKRRDSGSGRSGTTAKGPGTCSANNVVFYHYHKCENGTTITIMNKESEDAWRKNHSFNYDKDDHIPAPYADVSKNFGAVTKDPVPGLGRKGSSSYAPPPMAKEARATDDVNNDDVSDNNNADDGIPDDTTKTIGPNPITVTVTQIPLASRPGYVPMNFSLDGEVVQEGAKNEVMLVIKGFKMLVQKPITLNMYIDNPSATYETCVRRETGFFAAYNHMPRLRDVPMPDIPSRYTFPITTFLELEDKEDADKLKVTIVAFILDKRTGARMPVTENVATYEEIVLEYV